LRQINQSYENTVVKILNLPFDLYIGSLGKDQRESNGFSEVQKVMSSCIRY